MMSKSTAAGRDWDVHERSQWLDRSLGYLERFILQTGSQPAIWSIPMLPGLYYICKGKVDLRAL